MPFGGLLTMGIIAAVGGISSAAIGANASSNAANQQVSAEQAGINEQNKIYEENKGLLQPFVTAGTQTIPGLMAAAGNVPTTPVPTFSTPTLEQAQQMPGYQFQQEQGNKGILQGAAAAGGTISGGTLRSLAQYDTNLANTSYNTLFNQALSGYGANLASYQQGLATQQQGFNQLLSVTGMGAGAAGSLANTGTNAANSIAQLMAAQGNSQAAGTVGSANAITSGITGATNSITQSMLLNSLLGANGGSNNPGLGLGDLSSLMKFSPGNYSGTQGIGPG